MQSDIKSIKKKKKDFAEDVIQLYPTITKDKKNKKHQTFL